MMEIDNTPSVLYLISFYYQHSDSLRISGACTSIPLCI